MPSCPINFKKVDQNVIRIISGFVSILGILFIFSPNLSIVAVLFYDFLVRVVGYEKISPLFHLSKLLANLLKLKSDEIDAGPKEFALKLGFLFVAGSFLMFLFEEMLIAVVIMAMLNCCTILEAVFNYCIGCEIYALLKKAKLI
ncbi:MAG: hypothetical protein QG559_1316 [Campylobacterota bacterium]|nr:hypothetical protein [Campylobacterota bacterium]